ncbi:hypothetical protein Back2_05050 [Nocardioides baekrokdamisoli]|uniref:Uncharacterized protein n=1 Tax=Nocardioides baekrokdamisoli TaxID=1804624 RepID=A0A3G9IY41_9ACTN|nr:hypothetical protein Back2_05050 [Nocardioides baekrokdamisoli]
MQHVNDAKPRWRERPRPSLWSASRNALIPPIFAGVSWWAAGGYALNALAGTHYLQAHLSRWRSAGWCVGCLAVAVLMTWLVIAWLRRPVQK